MDLDYLGCAARDRLWVSCRAFFLWHSTIGSAAFVSRAAVFRRARGHDRVADAPSRVCGTAWRPGSKDMRWLHSLLHGRHFIKRAFAAIELLARCLQPDLPPSTDGMKKEFRAARSFLGYGLTVAARAASKNRHARSSDAEKAILRTLEERNRKNLPSKKEWRSEKKEYHAEEIGMT